MTEEALSKALEVWSLQILLNLSIVLGLGAAGMAMIQGYYRALEKRLSLRVSIELWQVMTVVLVDVALALSVIIGLMLLNPDMMSDVKMAVPFCPLATVCFAAALVLRLMHGGQDTQSPNFTRSLVLMLLANLINVLGFTFVMEAPGKEYLELHPSPFWTYIETHLRSNVDPAGIEMSQITFYICFPLLMAVAVWGIAAALRRRPVES